MVTVQCGGAFLSCFQVLSLPGACQRLRAVRGMLYCFLWFPFRRFGRERVAADEGVEPGLHVNRSDPVVGFV